MPGWACQRQGPASRLEVAGKPTQLRASERKMWTGSGFPFQQTCPLVDMTVTQLGSRKSRTTAKGFLPQGLQKKKRQSASQNTG